MSFMNPFMNRINPDITPRGLPSMDLTNSPRCTLWEYCQGEKGELCDHPAGDDARRDYCTNYRDIEKSLFVQGAEKILTNWGSKGELE